MMTCRVCRKEIIEFTDSDVCNRCLPKLLFKETEPDPVNHPSHYNRGRIEVIEFLEDQQLDFHLANAVKYICRAGHKDRDCVEQDLEKAIWYLRRRIELFKPDPRRPNDMKEKP